MRIMLCEDVERGFGVDIDVERLRVLGLGRAVIERDRVRECCIWGGYSRMEVLVLYMLEAAVLWPRFRVLRASVELSRAWVAWNTETRCLLTTESRSIGSEGRHPSLQ